MKRDTLFVFLILFFSMAFIFNSGDVRAAAKVPVVSIDSVKPYQDFFVSPKGFVLEGTVHSNKGIERIEVQICHEKVFNENYSRYVCTFDDHSAEYNAYSKTWRYEVTEDDISPGKDVDIKIQMFNNQNKGNYPLMETFPVAKVWPPDKHAPTVKVTYIDMIDQNLVSNEGFTVEGTATDDSGIEKVEVTVCYEESVFKGIPLMQKVCSVKNQEIPISKYTGSWEFEVSKQDIQPGRVWFEVGAVDVVGKTAYAPIQTLKVESSWAPKDVLPTVDVIKVTPFSENIASPNGFSVDVQASAEYGISKVLVDVCYVHQVSLGDELGYRTQEWCPVENGEAVDNTNNGVWVFDVLAENLLPGNEALLKLRAIDWEGTSSIEMLRRVPVGKIWPPDQEIPNLSMTKPFNNGDSISGGGSVIRGSARDDRGIDKVLVDVCYDKRLYIDAESRDVHYEICPAKDIEAKYNKETKEWKYLVELDNLSKGTEVRYKIQAVDIDGKKRVLKRTALVAGFAGN